MRRQRSCKYLICSKLSPSLILCHSRRLPLIILSQTLGQRKRRKHQRQIHGAKRKRLSKKPLGLLKLKRKSQLSYSLSQLKITQSKSPLKSLQHPPYIICNLRQKRYNQLKSFLRSWTLKQLSQSILKTHLNPKYQNKLN